MKISCLLFIKCLIILLASNSLHSQSYAFAFDYHDVLAEYDWQKAQQLSIPLVKNFKTWLHLPLLPYILYHAYKAHQQYHGGDSVIKALGQQIPSLRFMQETVFKLANCWKPNPKMHILIKELKAQGHLIYLASNMEPASLHYQKELHAEFFDLFDGICPAAADTKKPSFKYYQTLRTLIDTYQPNVPIIFIDDLESNITVLKNNDLTIHTIHYTFIERLLSELEIFYGIKVPSLMRDGLYASHIQNGTTLDQE